MGNLLDGFSLTASCGSSVRFIRTFRLVRATLCQRLQRGFSPRVSSVLPAGLPGTLGRRILKGFFVLFVAFN